MLKNNVKGKVEPEDEEFMRRVCRVMDTNSFETAVIRDDSSTSLRALFPVGALTNHQCVPNTRHIVNAQGELLVYAALPIAKGEEITMSYADVLWDTQMRRQFLLATKHFACQCSRCADVTECGSMLGALRCAVVTCQGNVLPNNPLSLNCTWTCDECSLTIKGRQIASIRSGIIAATEELSYEPARKVLRFLIRELSILVPKTNYIMMDMMFRVISLFGRSQDCSWSELTDEELNTKIQYCKKLIQCLNTLNCGNCTKKGLILYELYCSNSEKIKRISFKESNICTLLKNEIDFSTNETLLLEAMTILRDDIVAPKDYRELYNEKALLAQKIEDIKII